VAVVQDCHTKIIKRMKKKINEYSIEELSKLAESTEDTKTERIIEDAGTDVLSFVTFYNLKAGRDVVPQKTIYFLYKEWSKTPLPKKTFEIELSKYLVPNQIGGVIVYRINKKATEISAKAWELILLKSREATKIPQIKKHFELFCKAYDIKPGDYFVQSFVLYDMYDEFCYKTKKKTHMGPQEFHNVCEVYFKQKRLTQNKLAWWGLDPSIKKHLTMDRLLRLRRARLLYAKKKKSKKS
jgi:hypothetical protein